MVRGRLRAEWAQTSVLCSVVWNSAPSFGKKKRKTLRAEDFDPYSPKNRKRGQLTFKQMLDELCPKGRPKKG